MPTTFFVHGIAVGTGFRRKMRALLLPLAWLMILGNPLAVQAQDLQILSVDSSAYPEIRLQLVYKGKKKFDQNDLIINQDGRMVAFTLAESAPGSAPEKGRAVYFLLETSGNTYGKPLIEIRNGMISALDNLEPEDLLQVGTFGSFEADSTALAFLGEKFTNSHGSIREALQSRLVAKEDTAHRSDLYKNILESLNYIYGQKVLPQHRLFIALSAARNNSNFPATSSEVIGKAKDLGIPIHSLTILASDSAYSAGRMDMIAKKTGGKYFNCRNQIEITNAITDILNLPVPETMRDAQYEVVFTVVDELQLKTAKVDLNFRGSRQILIVNAPKSDTLIPDDYMKYFFLSIGILGLVVLIMILVNVFSKRRARNSDKETTLFTEDAETDMPVIREMVPPTPARKVPEVKLAEAPEPPKPPISKGPVLLVSQNGRTQTYPLTMEETFIGRHETNDICIKEITITGKHAVVRMKDKRVYIEDLGSTNGTFINGERIRSREIQSGDRIRLGNIEITVKI